MVLSGLDMKSVARREESGAMNDSSDRSRIDDYANSMFRFEYLHDQWIDRCAAYLRRIFGDRIRGSTVVDYAFGRGNWSVAFVRAGAARVHAIDASASNVERFSAYCRKNRLGSIEVSCANILESRLKIEADLVWVYGIFHHVPAEDEFVAALASLARDRRSLFLFYAYDAGSLRQAVVESSRRTLMCRSESQFRELSMSFSPAARLRARDDLTAPHISWHTGASLVARLRCHGLVPVREVKGFDGQWRHSLPRPEFAPLHIVCRPGQARGIEDRPVEISMDTMIISSMIHALLGAGSTTPAERRRLTIGLLNTHFSTFPHSKIEGIVRNDFLFLLYALQVHGTPLSVLPRVAATACEAALRKLRLGRLPRLGAGLELSLIGRFLTQDSFRL